MSDIVIFGERPGPNTDPERPLYPHTTTGAAANLIRLMGMSQEEYLRDTVRYNVCQNNHESPANTEIRAKVKSIIEMHRMKSNRARFVVLGREAARALPLRYRYEPFGHAMGDVMIIPHTSGVNRFYNSEEGKALMAQSLREFLGR